ncbi:MAG: DUF2004 domain-containing protein [Spirochaetales bacterium]|nr:DUF2004 domain-containing protein [Spirochaetales bacterium]
MAANEIEIERRKNAALDAIRKAIGAGEDESGAPLFISHHLEEPEDSYWLKHVGSARPEPARVLDILELKSYWGDENSDGIDTFDFSLPGDMTDYVISVRFDEEGQVESVQMES